VCLQSEELAPHRRYCREPGPNVRPELILTSDSINRGPTSGPSQSAKAR